MILKRKMFSFWKYTRIEELQSLLRIQLSRQILEYNDKFSLIKLKTIKSVLVEPTKMNLERLGIIFGFGEEWLF